MRCLLPFVTPDHSPDHHLMTFPRSSLDRNPCRRRASRESRRHGRAEETKANKPSEEETQEAQRRSPRERGEEVGARAPSRGRFSVPPAPAESARPPGVRSVFPQSSSRTRTRTAVWWPALVYILSRRRTRAVVLSHPRRRATRCAASVREFT